MPRWFMSVLSSVLVFSGFALCKAATQRSLTPDDVLRLEEFDSDVAVSPDGQWLAFVLKRAKAVAPMSAYSLGHWDRADVWLVSIKGGTPRNLTNGANDGAGFWAPTWSPNGQNLAMLSTRGGNIRVWVWSKFTHGVYPLTERGVGVWLPSDLHWVSDDKLVFSVLPSGETHRGIAFRTRIAENTNREWMKAWEGREPTARVLESGIAARLENRSHLQMAIVDVVTKKMRVISNAPTFATTRVSPDRRHVAFLQQVGVWRPDPDRPVRHLKEVIYTLAVADAQGNSPAHELSGTGEVFWGSLRWSPDSSELAAIGWEVDSLDGKEQVFRCKVADMVCRVAAKDPQFHVNVFLRNTVESTPPYLWHGTNDLLVYGGVRSSQAGKLAAPQWWAVDEAGRARPFFTKQEAVPTQVLAQKAGGFLGIVQGTLLHINGDGQQVIELAPSFSGKVTSIQWPSSPDVQVEGRLIFSVRREGTEDLYHLDLRTGKITQLTTPAPDATLSTFVATTETGVFAANNRMGTYLWLKGIGSESPSTVLETNTFLGEIAEGEKRKIVYRGLDGPELTAWILLPPKYQKGQKYPVVAWVYPGSVYGNDPPAWLTAINQSSPFNLQLLAAHGYVVLLPSMPLAPYGEVADPYNELTKGVLPAVDKLIELGIADPKRLGVIGQSYGGYATYGLVTQTNRFAAAVSLAGFSNLISMYGAFTTELRYESGDHEQPFQTFRMWNGETTYMGNPPWKDLGRFLRNSPLYFAERVRTPLLIMLGDFDPVIPIEQGEEFFTALYRQNKRAKFVRYLGEGHVFESPANIRDMWQKIYAWFDEFFGAAEAAAKEE